MCATTPGGMYGGVIETNALAIATEYADALSMREHIEVHGGYEEVTDAHLAGIADRFFAALDG